MLQSRPQGRTHRVEMYKCALRCSLRDIALPSAQHLSVVVVCWRQEVRYGKRETARSAEAKRKQLDAQIQALRVREQTQARKDDTHRKVLIGGVMLKMVKLDEMPEGRLTQLLDKHLDAERDRKLFGLEPKQQAQP